MVENEHGIQHRNIVFTHDLTLLTMFILRQFTAILLLLQAGYYESNNLMMNLGEIEMWWTEKTWMKKHVFCPP